MKLTFILLTAVAIQVSAKGLSQTITYSGKNVSLETVFAAIKKQTGFVFFYDKADMAKAKPVTIELKSATLQVALKETFRNQPLNFTIEGRTIVVTPTPALQSEDNTNLLSSFFPPPPIDIHGRITNEKGEPVEGVTVTVKGTDKVTQTNANGEFSLATVDRDAILIFTHVSMETFELKISGRTDLAISLRTKVSTLGDVQVIVNTGYEKVPKERATGAFEVIGTEELNRRGGSTILDRLEGVSTSIFFDKRNLSASNSSVPVTNIIIRGLSTLTSNPEKIKQPLIVINNFPYDGDISNINPNDVESITVLKDAAAASIYGARAANGVIVITTKQGRFSQKTQITFSSTFISSPKPDLFYIPKMSSGDVIDVETDLFSNGFYNSDLNSPTFPALSPVVEILAKRRAGLISAQDSATQLNNLRGIDVRDDFQRYIYRKSLTKQYYIGLNGGADKLRYSLSGGFDRSLSALIGNDFNRLTLNSNNTYSPVKNLSLQLDVRFSNTKTTDNSFGELGNANYGYRSRALMPYAKFTDGNGNYLSMAKDYREGYTDTAGAGKLLNWKYRVLDELNNSDNKTSQTDIVLNTGVSYRITKNLFAEANYQFQNTNGDRSLYYNNNTYYTRNQINLYTNLNSTNPLLRNPIPMGGILDQVFYQIRSQYGRGQLTFNKSAGVHQINALTGGEIREVVSTSVGKRSYGYSERTLSQSNIDYVNTYPLYCGRGSLTIPAGLNNVNSKQTDHFVSVYANAAYTYDKRYTISGSARRDAANVFGVDLQDKWKPFWSVGASWNITNESFFKVKAISDLRLRATYGYQGNVNNSLSPYTIISYGSAGFSQLNLPFATISTPANPGLSWENTKHLNIGLDFSALNERVSGSIDVYNKRSDNLILLSLVDRTTGIASVARNSAGMTGKGFEISLATANFKGAFSWRTEIGFSHVTNKIAYTQLDYKTAPAGGAISGSGINIVNRVGVSPFAIFSYTFAGLDPATGDPLGYLGKTVSKDYLSIANQLFDTANVVYHGSAIPTTFGNLNNIFSYKDISLLVNISYRFNYYFRKSTISYYNLYNAGFTHYDYTNRWKVPGDEAHTTVPSMIYPLTNDRRDVFYANSSANVLKADNIRLQNIRLGYTISNRLISKLSIRALQFYLNAENLGILWRANKEHIDPDYDRGNAPYPALKRYTVGVKLDF